MVDADTPLGPLLEAHPELTETLRAVGPGLRHLREPLLERLVAPHLTVAEAARLAGVPPAELVGALRRALEASAPAGPTPAGAPPAAGRAPAGGGSPAGQCPAAPGGPAAPPPTAADVVPGFAPPPPPMPSVLAALPPSRQVHLDVRPEIRQGREPFPRIMAVVAALPTDAALVLRAPFEPVPLYAVLGRRGLAHWTECRASNDWVVWFYREPEVRVGQPGASGAGTTGTAPAGAPRGDTGIPHGARPAAGPPPAHAGAGPAGGPAAVATGAAPSLPLRLDVRGLEPPEPLVRVLERVERLRAGEVLEVLHDRRPIFLYPQLDARGFAHETDEPAPGVVRIRIRRLGP